MCGFPSSDVAAEVDGCADGRLPWSCDDYYTSSFKTVLIILTLQSVEVSTGYTLPSRSNLHF